MNTTRVSLLLRVRDPRNGQAWSEFISIYRPLLKRYSQSRGLPDFDAEDVAQDCLAVIARKIRQFNYDPRRGRFRSWLRRIVDYRVSAVLRRKREQQAASGDFTRPQQCELSPDEEWERIWLEEHLRYCLGVLQSHVEPHTYEAFRRTAIQEQPVEEVCKDLQLSANQVYVARSRLTRRLQDLMRELVGGEDDPAGVQES